MFTDNKDFYPTPQNLIDKMLDGLDWKMIHTILEPSAGYVSRRKGSCK